MLRGLVAGLGLLLLLPGCDAASSHAWIDVTWTSGVFGGVPLTGLFVRTPIQAHAFHLGRAGIAVVELLSYPGGSTLGVVYRTPAPADA